MNSKEKIVIPKSLPVGYNFCRCVWHPDNKNRLLPSEEFDLTKSSVRCTLCRKISVIKNTEKKLENSGYHSEVSTSNIEKDESLSKVEKLENELEILKNKIEEMTEQIEEFMILRNQLVDAVIITIPSINNN